MCPTFASPSAKLMIIFIMEIIVFYCDTIIFLIMKQQAESYNLCSDWLCASKINQRLPNLCKRLLQSIENKVFLPCSQVLRLYLHGEHHDDGFVRYFIRFS